MFFVYTRVSYSLSNERGVLSTGHIRGTQMRSDKELFPVLNERLGSLSQRILLLLTKVTSAHFKHKIEDLKISPFLFELTLIILS
jgi:hypothetical protein